MFRRSIMVWCMFLICTAIQAEVLELEGKVKSIDKDARTISVVRKTAKGEKTLELEVAKKAGDLSEVEVGDSVSFSYDPALELITKIAEQGESSMTLAQLVERLQVFDPLPPGTKHRNPQGAGVDQGFVLGYMTAIQELAGERFQGTFYEQRNALKKHLIRHPEDGNQPAHEIMIRVLEKAERQK